ncbi:unnamed protein product [Meganyctiphanes norvegica]|uniref:BTB domain-containing protein n=1 Tax=Meganyctiphanes norvegica TaxID=48144 RepID=A0AAV2SPK6_MEGNR
MENSKNAHLSDLKNSEEQGDSLPVDFSHPVNVKMEAIEQSQQSRVHNPSSLSQMDLNELFELNPNGGGENHNVNMNSQFESNNVLEFGNEASANNYQLRWNDHIPYFTNILQGLREQNELTDVTFACEDGIVVAHKLVLSSCSAYLRVLFSRLGTPHPVIFLKNTPSSVVRQLMEFVYCGSVDVSEKDLVEVMSLGKSLQIQGLGKFKLPKKDVSNEENASSIIPEDKSTTTNIRSKSPLLPGEIREPPDYILFNQQDLEHECDAENNNIEEPDEKKNAKMTSPKTSNQLKNKKQSPDLKHTQKRKRENGTLESSSATLKRRSCIELTSEKYLMGTQAMFTSDTGRRCYTPFIKKLVGKYYQDHGQQEALKFVKEKFDMDIPDRTMRKWRTYYMELQKN